MSGHSKWATIKHKKGAIDKARGKLFAKLARQLEVAARTGGMDVDTNAALRTMVQKAKAGQMTKDAIDRAINKLATADLKPGPGVAKRQADRARTTGSVLSSILKAVIWIIAIAMILGEFGFNLGPVIASAGVIGVAIGLGAQTLVRDILSGIFMLIEDQYGVGDQIKVLEIEGVVEKVGLRITTVRDKDDVLWYVRNGEILVIGNGSQKR
jgi:small-conductance mechanosensitive channel